MIDPASFGADLQPGDKISLTFHKAKAEPGGSFVQNAQSAGMIPGGPSAPAAPPAGGMNPMAGLMRQRLGLA